MTRLKTTFVDFSRVKGRKRSHKRPQTCEMLEERIKAVRRRRRDARKDAQ